MVASVSNNQQMEAQDKKREYGETTIIYLAPQQPTTSQHWSVATAHIMHFLLSPNTNETHEHWSLHFLSDCPDFHYFYHPNFDLSS